jgi:hypothetical protein
MSVYVCWPEEMGCLIVHLFLISSLIEMCHGSSAARNKMLVNRVAINPGKTEIDHYVADLVPSQLGNTPQS